MTNSRRISLPAMEPPAMTSSMEKSMKWMDRNMNRKTYTSHIRRSVSGMKSLLPLKLSSPPLPQSDSWPLPKSTSRSTFGLRRATRDGRHSSSTDLEAGEYVSAYSHTPMIIRPDRYRDTPIYTKPGSPILSRAYYTDEDICFQCSPPGSSCEESCIINGYETSDADEAESEEDDPFRRSDLSIKCLGEDLLHDEGAWLGKQFNRWGGKESDCLPQILARSMPPERGVLGMENFISDSTTSSFCDSDNDFFACATALASVKAQVVDVNINVDQPSTLSIEIPPRSSSLLRIEPQTATPTAKQQSWMAFCDSPPSSSQSWTCDSDEDSTSGKSTFKRTVGEASTGSHLDLAMASPPTSPVDYSIDPLSPGSPSTIREISAPPDLHRDMGSSTNHEGSANSPASNQGSIISIIGALEESISCFPYSLLLPDTPCIAAIRAHLLQFSCSVGYLQPNLATPPPSPFSRPNEWDSHGELVKLRPKTTMSLPIGPAPNSFSTSEVFSPLYRSSNPYLVGSPHKSNCRGEYPPLPPLNLQPLRTIFPDTSDFMRSALCSHVLAYNFITAINFNSSSFLNLPFYTSTSRNIPSKAATTLGIPAAAKLPRLINTGKDAVRVTALGMEKTLYACIEQLVKRMEARARGDREDGPVGGGFIRALVEVVKVC